MVKKIPLLIFLLGLISCAQKVHVYRPINYEPPKKTYSYKIKIVPMEDKTGDWIKEGPAYAVKGKVNLAKGGNWNYNLPPFTPEVIAEYLAQEFRAHNTFSSIEVVDSASNPAENEIVLTGEINQATWDCPDGPVGPLQDSCKYRFKIKMFGAFGDGASWSQRLVSETLANYDDKPMKTMAKRRANSTITAITSFFHDRLTGFLDDPIRRLVEGQSFEQAAKLTRGKVKSGNWSQAHRIALHTKNNNLITEVCTAMSEVPSKNPSDVRKFMIQAGVLAKDDNYAGAIAKYDEAIEIAPSEKKLHFNRAVVLAALKKYDEAVLSMRCYQKLNPTSQEQQKSEDKIAAWEIKK